MLRSTSAVATGDGPEAPVSAALAVAADDSGREQPAGRGEARAREYTASDHTATSGASSARWAASARIWRRGWLLRLVSPVTVLVIWQLISELHLVSERKLPPPTQVWSAAVSLTTTNNAAYGTLQGAMVVSLERVAIGFAVGGGLGMLLAFTAGLSRIGENAVDPLMQMLRTLPLFGLIPVFIVWFGIGEGPKIILIAIGSAIPLYLNTFAGIRNVDPRLGELGRVLRLTRREMVTQIVVPGAMPQILVGLRQSLGVAWLALVVAEQINANAGLGFMITQATQFVRNDVIIVALLVYCVLGLLTDWLVRVLERRALAWRRSFVAG